MFGFNGVFNRKPRQFEYRPLYYDPEKEAREQRRRELGLAPRDEKEGERKPGDYLRSRVSLSRERFSESQRKQKSNAFKIILVIAIMIALLIWLIMSI